MLFNSKKLKGFTVQGTDNAVGVVQDILFDERFWAIRYLVVDTNKWLPASRKVVLSPISLGEPDHDSNTIPVSLSSEKIKSSPPLTKHQPVSRWYEAELFRYYGYGAYWTGPDMWGLYPHPALLHDLPFDREPKQTDPAHDCVLRSVNEVSNYQLKSHDNNSYDNTEGQIRHFMIDCKNWSIPGFLINTRRWLPGGKDILISHRNVRSIRWHDHSVHVDLSTQQIQTGPELGSKASLLTDNPDAASWHTVKRVGNQ